jgi:DNA-binding CsgD family transcriptional regulator
MGRGVANIAEIVPEIHDKVPGLNPPPALEPEVARFRLFDSITSFLKNLSQSQPLLLVLDDLHWADQASLLLMEFLARELKGSALLVIGAYRDVEVSRQHPLSRTLGNLTRERLFQRVHLGGLNSEEVGRFLETASRVTPSPGLVEALQTRTEGNPLFVSEVLRLMETEGLQEDGSWDVRIPEGLIDTIGRRLDQLSENCNRMLTIASVIGRQFTLDQLAQLLDDYSEDQLLEVVEEALTARVIEELPQTVGIYQFTHALIQETLTGELSTTRKVRLHARIAGVLEDLYGDAAEAHATELAHHFAEAEAVLGNENLVKYSFLAGERALETYAWEEALSHFQRALLAKEGEPLDDRTAASLFGLARAQSAILVRSQVGEVVASLDRVFDYYASMGDVARAVAVAEHPFYPPVGHGHDAAQLVDKALGLVSPNSLAAGRLLSRYGWFLTGEGDFQQAKEALDQALAISRRENDVRLEMRTLAIATRVELINLHFEQALKNGLRAVELAALSNELQTEMSARMWTSDAMATIGDSEGARRHIDAALSLADQLRDHNGLRTVLRRCAVISARSGDWSSALTFIGRGLDAVPGDPNLLAVQMMIHYEVGDFAEGEAIHDKLLEASLRSTAALGSERMTPIATMPFIARITGVAGREGVAEAFLSQFSVAAESKSMDGLETRRAVVSCLLGVMVGDAERVREHYGSLESIRGRMPHLGVISIHGSRLLGLSAYTMNNLDQATVYFEEALDFCRKAGYRPELAWTCCDYADCLIERKGVGDLDKAKIMLDEAQVLSSEIGMRPLSERVMERIGRLQSRSSGGADYPDGLSPREVEVLALICTGKSNREIAEELIISLSTVAHHVSNIFNKTGVANRAEAATYAARHEIAPN